MARPIQRRARIESFVKATAVDLVRLERALYGYGLVATAHVINDASRKLGWEAAEKIKPRRSSTSGAKDV